MQELTLAEPGRMANTESALELEETELRREFEERLAESGTLAFRVARGVLRDPADAEDVAQEALLKAFRRFRHLRDRSRFRAWLVRIVFRLALDQARSSRRRERRETLGAVCVPRPTAEDLAAAGEFAGRVEKAMETLPEKLRLVLVLAAIDGHSLEEVAAIVNLPVGTVKSRLHIARRKIAEKLR
ncbi:MAG: sigma-70 family RNA polymerase sigma factor [Acidobacteria bacterium]|nr:sigma-70 family RNA polymerase sigma factor [Acidobacteriota bacterium]